MSRVKICGFTLRKDIEEALALGIKIIGINFFDKSPRYVTAGKAEELLKNLPGGVISIGVLVNPDEKTLFELAAMPSLSGIQFHGDEPPSLLEKFKKRFPGKISIKALRVKDTGTLSEGILKYRPDFYLLDSYVENSRGGTGRQIPLSLLKGAVLPWSKIFLV